MDSKALLGARTNVIGNTKPRGDQRVTFLLWSVQIFRKPFNPPPAYFNSTLEYDTNIYKS